MGLNFCPYCGEKVQSDSNFCSNCGSNLNEFQNLGKIETPLGCNDINSLVNIDDTKLQDKHGNEIIYSDCGKLTIYNNKGNKIYSGYLCEKKIHIKEMKKPGILIGFVKFTAYPTFEDFIFYCDKEIDFKQIERVFQDEFIEYQSNKNLLLSRSMCPRCMSKNIEIYNTATYGARPPKTKTVSKTSLNLNPLRPFTVFNTNSKTKVIDKGSAGYTVVSYICKDCGKIF